MQSEVMAVEDFANGAMSGATGGFHSDVDNPAMATPGFVAAAQFVVQGSTICLVC